MRPRHRLGGFKPEAIEHKEITNGPLGVLFALMDLNESPHRPLNLAREAQTEGQHIWPRFILAHAQELKIFNDGFHGL